MRQRYRRTDLQDAAFTSVFKTNLLNHQVEAVEWMLAKEEPDGIPIDSKWYRIRRFHLPTKVTKKNGSVTKFLEHQITGSRASDDIRPAEGRGGLLADRMGLGKTASVIALIARDLADVRAQHRGPVPTPHTTLVVASPSILPVWAEEIRKHTVPGTLRVLEHYGEKRSRDPAHFAAFDIVLTTWAIVSKEWNTATSPLHMYN